MILRKTGAVTPELHVLGAVQLPSFLIDADRPVLIDAGMTCMAKRYTQEIREILSGRTPEHLFLTHTHTTT